MDYSGILDSRDLIERLEELQGMRDAFLDTDGLDTKYAEADLNEEEWTEYNALVSLADSGIDHWDHGAQFVPESDFEDYAREMADDGLYPNVTVSWPYTCIDWSQAADELSQDYTLVTFLGTDYYVR